MSAQEKSLDRARVASPCPVSWDNMQGDERVRFCQECQLKVYNISEMTRVEAEALIASTEGRICARLFRRADGTILTKDCPVGLRAFRRRISRMAGAALTTVLSLSASIFGQSFTRTSRDESGNNQAMITRSFFSLNPQEGRATCWGTITDPNAAAMAGVQATIVNEKTKYKRVIKSDEEGQFKFGLLEPGFYTLRIESPGFTDFVREHLNLHSNEEMRLDVTLNPAGMLLGVIVCEEPLINPRAITIDGVRVKINED